MTVPDVLQLSSASCDNVTFGAVIQQLRAAGLGQDANVARVARVGHIASPSCWFKMVQVPSRSVAPCKPGRPKA